MKKAIRKMHGGKRAGAGRPATGREKVRTFRLSDEFITKLDAWARDNSTNRTEALRRLVELGLERSPSAHRAKPLGAKRAAELAAKVIDGVIPAGTPAEERKVRKRKILEGPSAIRHVRRDKA